MQETICVNREGVKELKKEFFGGQTVREIEAKMDKRLKKLRRQGHTLMRRVPKIGRNQPCPCGSGRKFKRCCIVKAR